MIYGIGAWYGIWYGIWYGMVWYGMAWYGMVSVPKSHVIMLVTCDNMKIQTFTI